MATAADHCSSQAGEDCPDGHRSGEEEDLDRVDGDESAPATARSTLPTSPGSSDGETSAPSAPQSPRQSDSGEDEHPPSEAAPAAPTDAMREDNLIRPPVMPMFFGQSPLSGVLRLLSISLALVMFGVLQPMPEPAEQDRPVTRHHGWSSTSAQSAATPLSTPLAEKTKVRDEKSSTARGRRQLIRSLPQSSGREEQPTAPHDVDERRDIAWHISADEETAPWSQSMVDKFAVPFVRGCAIVGIFALLHHGMGVLEEKAPQH